MTKVKVARRAGAVEGKVKAAAGHKVLTLKQPFAEAVLLGLKTREYRSWPTSHRGLLLVHAGKALCKDGLARYGLDKDGLDFGAIVGAVEVTDVEWDKAHQCYAWVLARPRRLREHVPCPGQLGLWRLPPDLTRQVEEALR